MDTLNTSSLYSVDSSVPLEGLVSRDIPFPDTCFALTRDSNIQNLVFVDAGVDGLESVLQGIQNAEVVVLGTEENGIESITGTLQRHRNLASVHFVSHGQQGAVWLGDTRLDAATLEQYRQSVQSWSNAVIEGGDFLFYGCNVASGEVGANFIKQLQDVTGVDVAASDDITGSQQRGGNWELEAFTGAIETDNIFSSAFMATYDSTLAVPSVLFVVGNTNLSTSDEAIQSRLQGLGYDVVIRNDGASRSTDANGQNLVFISESVASSRVNTKFTDAAIPVISAESYIYDDLALTAATAGTDYDKAVETNLAIIDGANPLAAGLSGTVTAYTSPSDVNWGVTNANAVTVATLPGNSDRATIFAYDEASTLINGISAPSRRVGLFIGSNANQLTNEGWQLFDAAVNWAAEATVVPPDVAQLSFSQEQFTVDEDAGVATITVTRTGDTSNAVSVAVSTTATGTAEAGTDYTFTEQTLNFAASETTQTITIPILDDGLLEGFETVEFVLSNPVGGELGSANAILTIVDNDASGKILFVADQATLGSSDQAIRNQLETLGYEVTVQDDNVVSLSDAIGQDVIFISESVSSGRVNTKLNDATIPIISAEAYLFDDLELTGNTLGVDYGTLSNLTDITIANATLPLAAGLSGQITVYGTPGEIAWGQPTADAEIVAVLPSDAGRAAIFAYDAADTLASGATAPAKRLGFFMASDANQLTSSGLQLLEYAFQWALEDNTPPPIDITPPAATLSAAAAVTTEGGTSYEFTVNYTDATAVDFESLGSTDIRVTGPNGFEQLATFVKASPSTDASSLTATYRFTPPGGSWDGGDNGTFDIALEDGAVSDVPGNTTSATLLGQFTVTISTDPGILKLGETELSVSEGAGFVTLEFLRTDGSAGTATLQYATIELDATPDVDYPATIETLTFAPGETRKTVDIPIVDDGDIEPDEQFGIGLTSATGAILGAPRTAIITILDNDSPPPPPPSNLNVLFIAGDPNLSTSDQMIREQFELLGHTVTIQDDDLSSSGDILGQDLVFISESVSSSKVTDKFASASIPVIASEAYVFDDMGLTGAATNADYGTLTGQTTLVIDPAANGELTAGLSGSTTVFSTASEFAWGDPNDNAFTIATLPSDGNQAGIFAYDEGATLVNGTLAIARRVGFFIGSDAQNVSADGWALFGASIAWAAGNLSPRLAFALSELSVNESDGTVDITVRRTGDATGEVRVDYATEDGSAQAGADYSATSGTLIFGDGQTLGTITVPILEDAFVENPETVNLTLSNPVGIELGAVSTAILKILDNDVLSGNFVRETVLSGLTLPTAFAWTPDGNTMFIAEKSGLVKVYQNGTLLETPFIDIRDQVNEANDRGLAGIAVHPDFPNTPYVYLAYTFDPPEVYNFATGNSAPDGAGNRPSRVVRIEADDTTDYTTAVAGSETIILGKNSLWEYTTQGNSTGALGLPPSGITETGENIQDYLTTDSTSHSVGSLHFASDGSLFVSNGDGASFNFADPRAVRVQDIDNLSGKILRVDAMTGEGLSDNPFFNGDPTSNRSKVYSYGFRNPFRFTLHPETDVPFIGDVGWTQWEEINTGIGTNHGWPFYEGGSGVNLQTTEYQDLPEAQAFYASGELVTPSIFALDHSGEDRMRAIIMGDFYDGTAFPLIYDGALFFAGFERGNVYYMTFEPDGDVASVNEFDTGVPGIAQMTTGPDSHLYFLNLFEGSLGRWRFQA